MSDQLLFCCDLARRETDKGRISRLEGWCFSACDVRGLYLKHSDIGYEQVPHGFYRPDVGKAYPAYTQAAHSGFRLTTGSNSISDQANLFVRLEACIHCVTVNLTTQDIQTIELSDRTLLDQGDE